MDLDFETLGGDKEITRQKGIFLIVCMGILFILFYAIINAGASLKNILYFYIALLIGGGLFWIGYDMATPQKDPDMIDTVTVESDAPLSSGKNILVGIGLSILLGYYITTTGQAFLSGSPFGVLINVFETNVGNAFTSGLVGMVEVIVFFGVLFPTLYSLIYNYTDSVALTIPISLLAISLIFMSFHMVVYRYDQSALMTVFMFGLLFQALPTLLTRNLTIALMLHFCNNFLVILWVVQKYSILLIF